MHQIALFPISRQAEKTARRQTRPARPEPYRPTAFIPGVHSLDPACNGVSFLPESLELADRIDLKSILRTFLLRPGRPAVGSVQALPLVRKSISRRTHLPDYAFVPTEPSRWYQVYAKDVQLCRRFPATPPAEQPGTCRRSAIREFSRKSQSRVNHLCTNSGHRIKSQFLLTYHNQNPTDGREVKRHLAAFLAVIRRMYQGIDYLWGLEFQTTRGVPHYHIFLTIPPCRKNQKKLAAAWCRITTSKGQEPSTAQYRVHAHPKNWMTWKMDNGGYMTKQYIAKVVQKDVPPQFQNVGRFWGNSSGLKPVPTIITPETVAALTEDSVIPWEPAAVRHYFDKILRRWQERQMNRDKDGKRRTNPKTGKPLSWRKASMIRQESELSGRFKIANGSCIITRLLHYVQFNAPDQYSLAAAVKERTPF